MMKLLALTALGAASVSASSNILAAEKDFVVPADIQAKIDEATAKFTSVDEHERFLLEFCPYLESLFAYQVECECTDFIDTLRTGVTTYKCTSLIEREYPPFNYKPSFEGTLVAKILASEYNFNAKICLSDVGIDLDLITNGNTGTLPTFINAGDLCLTAKVEATVDPFSIGLAECKIIILDNLGGFVPGTTSGQPLEECTTCTPCDLDNGGTGVTFKCSFFDTVDFCVPFELPFLAGQGSVTDETSILDAMSYDTILEAAREKYAEAEQPKTMLEKFLCSLLGVGC